MFDELLHQSSLNIPPLADPAMNLARGQITMPSRCPRPSRRGGP